MTSLPHTDRIQTVLNDPIPPSPCGGDEELVYSFYPGRPSFGGVGPFRSCQSSRTASAYERARLQHAAPWMLHVSG